MQKHKKKKKRSHKLKDVLVQTLESKWRAFSRRSGLLSSITRHSAYNILLPMVLETDATWRNSLFFKEGDWGGKFSIDGWELFDVCSNLSLVFEIGLYLSTRWRNNVSEKMVSGQVWQYEMTIQHVFCTPVRLSIDYRLW